MPDVSGGRYTDAMVRALKSAGVGPGDISLLTPHGVGSGMLDHFEANSLAAVFPNGNLCWPTMMLVKAAVGHTLGGCDLVETAASLVALGHGRVPAVTRCAEPDPGLPIGSSSGDDLPERWVLLKCTNGFAGQNGAIVLRSPEA